MSTIGDYSQLVVAVTVVINCYLSFRNGLRAQRIAEGIHTIKKDVATVEKATNSMKDALVASTAKASHAEGMVEGRAEGIASQKEK